MKHTIVIGLLVLGACTGSSGTTGQWLGATPGAGPTQVAGSAANTTNAFDGTYAGVSVKTGGGGNKGPRTAGTTVNAPCQQFDKPPTMTVTNGLAQFEVLGVTFAGYVTPQGHLTMQSGYGATLTGQVKPALADEDFDGDFDAQTHVLHGRVIGACPFDVAWQRTA
jgi:hypothetical protein